MVGSGAEGIERSCDFEEGREARRVLGATMSSVLEVSRRAGEAGGVVASVSEGQRGEREGGGRPTDGEADEGGAVHPAANDHAFSHGAHLAEEVHLYELGVGFLHAERGISSSARRGGGERTRISQSSAVSGVTLTLVAVGRSRSSSIDTCTPHQLSHTNSQTRAKTHRHPLDQSSDHSGELRIHLDALNLRCSTAYLVPHALHLGRHARPADVGLVEQLLVGRVWEGKLDD